MTSEAPVVDLLSFALQSQNLPDILSRVKTVLENEPENPIALAAQAVAQHRGGEQPAALESFIKALTVAMDDHDDFSIIAQALHGLGLSETLLSAFEVRANPASSSGDDWRILGKFQYFLDRNVDATRSLQLAADRGESSALVWLDLARAAVDAQQPDPALNALDRIVDISPEINSAPVIVTLRIAALAQQKRTLDALNLWKTSQLSLEGSATRRRGLELANALLVDSPPRIEEALDLLSHIEAKIADPQERWPVLQTRVQAMMAGGKFEEALAMLDATEAEKISDAARLGSLFWKAIALERLGRIDASLDKTEEGLHFADSEADVSLFHLVRGRLFCGKNEFSKSLESLMVVKEDQLPAELRPQAFLFRGIALSGTGQHELALAQFQPALATEGSASLHVQILAWEGRALNSLRRFQDALKAFADARESGIPPAALTFVVLGEAQALQGLGRTDEAIEALERALQPQPDANAIAEILVAKAWYLAAQAKIDAALAALESPLVQQPELIAKLQIARAAIAQRAGPQYLQAALSSADAALVAVGKGSAALDFRISALNIRIWALRELQNHGTALESIEEAEQLKPALAEEPDFISVHWGTLLSLGRNQDALAMIEKVINGQSPIGRHPMIRAFRAETLRIIGNLSEYFSTLQQAADVPAEYQNDRNAWFAAAMAETALRRWDEAQSAFANLERIDKAFSESPEVRIMRGLSLVGVGKYESALKLVENTETLSIARSWKVVAAMVRAQALNETGDFDGWNAALDLLMALAAEDSGVDPAIASFAVFQKANGLVRQNLPEKALAVLDTARNLPKSVSMADFVQLVESMTRAGVLLRLQKHESALESINNALEIQNRAAAMLPPPLSEQGQTLWMKGIILSVSERNEEALRAFEQAESAGYAGNEAIVWQGYVLLNLEDPDRALGAFEKAIQNASRRNDRAQQVEALVGKGRALHAAHVYDSALSVYREALRIGSATAESDPQYWRRIGETYYALGRYIPALGAFRRGWTIRQSTDLALGISAVLIRQKQYGDAQNFIENDIPPLTKKDSRIIYNYGSTLWSSGKRDQAMRLIKEAAGAGVIEAVDFVNNLKPKSEGASGWWDNWFGDQALRGRRIAGACLLVMTASALSVPAVAYYQKSLDWKAAAIPALVGLVLLLIPSIKGLSLSGEGIKLEIEPSALKGAEDQPAPNLVPLSSGVIVAASIQLIGGRSKEIQQPELMKIVEQTTVTSSGWDVIFRGISTAGRSIPPKMTIEQ